MALDNTFFTQVKTSKLTQWNAESLQAGINNTDDSFYIFFGKPLSRDPLFNTLTSEQVKCYNLLRHILDNYSDYPELFNQNHFLLYKKVSEKINSYDSDSEVEDSFYDLSVGVDLDSETWERNYYEVKYIGKENEIPLIDDSLNIQYRIWKDIIGMKKVGQNDVSLGFRKITWNYGEIYDEWNDLDDMSDPDTRFYVMTTQRRVYKCISNNNGAPSIHIPNHVTLPIKEYADGYRWKYMFNITTSQIRKFFHPDYLPVNRVQTIIDGSVTGTIDKIMIINGGEGYTPNSSAVPIYTGGNGSGIVSISGIIQASNGTVTTVTPSINIPEESFIEGLSDGTVIPFLIRQDNDGIAENSYGLATKTNGTLTLNVRIPGSGYASGQAFIVFSPVRALGSTNAQGVLNKVEVSLETGENGTNFTFAKSVAVPANGTVTKHAVLHPVISPFGGHGSRPEKELLAKNVLVNVRIAYSEGDELSVENDFRQIGFIKNPKDRDTGNTFTESVVDLTTKMVLSPSSVDPIEFEPDDTIIGKTSLASGICVDSSEIDPLDTERTVRFIQNYTSTNVLPFSVGEIVYPQGSPDQQWEVDSIIHPEVSLYSGDILFVSNIEPIPRDPDQIESITLAIEF